MFGLFKTLVYVVLLILIGCGIFFYSYRVPITGWGLTHLLNNPTTVEEVDISISLSRISGNYIAIQNPPASRKKIKDAVRSKVIDVRLKLSSFLTRPVVIEELYFDHVEFFIDIYNVTGSESNWKTVIRNMNARAVQKREEGLNPRGVIIKKLVIQNLIFTYRHPTLTAGAYRTLKPIPNLVLYDIGKGHPVTPSQLAILISQVALRQFTTVTGFTDLLRGIPLLPFEFLKNIFIQRGRERASLEEFFSIPEQKADKEMGFFKKIFSCFQEPATNVDN